jgi:hypothetical protein
MTLRVPRRPEDLPWPVDATVSPYYGQFPTDIWAVSQSYVKYLGGPDNSFICLMTEISDSCVVVTNASPAISTLSFFLKKLTWPGACPGICM